MPLYAADPAGDSCGQRGSHRAPDAAAPDRSPPRSEVSAGGRHSRDRSRSLELVPRRGSCSVERRSRDPIPEHGLDVERHSRDRAPARELDQLRPGRRPADAGVAMARNCQSHNGHRRADSPLTRRASPVPKRAPARQVTRPAAQWGLLLLWVPSRCPP